MTALSRGYAACAILVVLGAMVSLSFGCSNSSRVEQTDGGSVEQTDAGSVVGCDPNTQPIALYMPSEGGLVAQPVVSDGTVFIATTDTVVTVPVAGGAYGVLAQESTPHGLAVLSGLVYFAGLEIVPSMDPMVPAESVPTLYEVPVGGGAASAVPGFGSFVPLASDDTSLYLGAGAGRIVRWNPTSNMSVDLDIDSTLLVDDLAIAGDYLYLAAQDISHGGFANGLIGRIPLTGGSLDRLVVGIGHPFHVAADAQGIYWAEDPRGLVGYANGRLASSPLGGGGTITLMDKEPVSVALMNGTAISSLGTEIDAVPTNGGQVRTIATGLTNAGMIVGQSGRVIWVDPAIQPLGSATSESHECLRRTVGTIEIAPIPWTPGLCGPRTRGWRRNSRPRRVPAIALATHALERPEPRRAAAGSWQLRTPSLGPSGRSGLAPGRRLASSRCNASPEKLGVESVAERPASPCARTDR
jgi:hypothetical protein